MGKLIIASSVQAPPKLSLDDFLKGFTVPAWPEHASRASGYGHQELSWRCVCVRVPMCECVPAPTGDTAHSDDFSCFLVGVTLGRLLSGGGQFF